MEPDYTHALHAQAVRASTARLDALAKQPRTDDGRKALAQASVAHQVLLEQHVLARRGQIVYCARIVAPYTVPNGPQCWTLDTLFPERTRLTIPCRNVIECPPDRCSCLPGAALDRVGGEA